MNKLNILKNYNRESLYSTGSLLLAVISFYNISFISNMINLENELISRFDFFIFELSNMKWHYASLDITFWTSMVISLMFLILSLYFGIKSIRKSKEGRMLGIISTTLSSFILLVVILLTIFPL